MSSKRSSKRRSSGRTGHFKAGASVWVHDDALCFVRGVISEKVDKGTFLVKVEGSRKAVSVRAEDLEFCSTSARQEAAVNDLTTLPDLHNPALLASLHERFQQDVVYTMCGGILIAMNPFKKIRGLYEPSTIARYVSAAHGAEMAPHAYVVTKMAYQAMIAHRGRNQTIMVSGESGAGKTYNTKVVMGYLTVVSNASVDVGLSDVRASMKRGSAARRGKAVLDASVSQRVLEANPVMEAFGNAKTLRNDNSSRFGKLIEIQFSPGARLEGASIDVYLLEKARVVKQQDGERNYHIFYEMAAGLSSEEKRELRFPKDLASCAYINPSAMRRADVSDKDQWAVTRAGFDVLGFSAEDRGNVLRVASAVLHLGNIQFKQAGNEGSRVASSAADAAADAAKLLGVETDELVAALTTRGLNIGGAPGQFLANFANPAKMESLTKAHTVKQAEEARDALAMALYERSFGWLTYRINESIGSKSAGATKRRPKSLQMQATVGRRTTAGNQVAQEEYFEDYSIGLLDIFGFEVFEHNSFEQLLINYCNEKLQAQFNDHVFRLEAALFESEGLDWQHISWPDNEATVQMVEGRPIGLLSLVDEQCLYPNGNDASLHAKLQSNLTKGKFAAVFEISRHHLSRQQFLVAHFAGPVCYSVEGFCAKNKNELRQEAIDLTRASRDAWLSVLLPPDAGAAGGGSDSAEYFAAMAASSKRTMRSSLQRHKRVSPRTSKLQMKTVSAHFRSSLNVALNHINASQPHYIRCLKSTDENLPDRFDRRRVMEQLAYSGVLEVVKVARAGYPTRFTLKAFVQSFFMLRRLGRAKGGSRRRSNRRGGGGGGSGKGDWRAQCQEILDATGLQQLDEYQIGTTKVFLKARAYQLLEVAKAEAVIHYVLVLQRAMRTFLVTLKATKKLREKRRHKQKAEKAKEAARKQRRKEERAVVHLQRHTRGILARASVQPMIQRRFEEQLQQAREKEEEERRRLWEEEERLRKAEEAAARKRQTDEAEKREAARQRALREKEAERARIAREKELERARLEALRQRAEAQMRIRKAFKRKVMADRLRELREESVRQRSAVMLQSLARVLKSQKLANNLYAQKVTVDAARTLQGLSRMLAAKKTRQMLEDQEEEAETDEDNHFLMYVVPFAMLFLFTQPVLVLGIGAVVVAMALGAGLTLEAQQRQGNYETSGKAYARRARRHRKNHRERYDDADAEYDEDPLSSDYDDYDSEFDGESDFDGDSGEDDEAFYKSSKGFSKKLTRTLSRRSEKSAKAKPKAKAKAAKPKPKPKAKTAKPRKLRASSSAKKLPPARKQIASKKLAANAFEDFDNFYGEQTAKKGNNKTTPRRFR